MIDSPSRRCRIVTKINGSNAQWLDESSLPPLITAAEQLAVDEAFLNEAELGYLKNPVVRTWQATAPAVILGSSSQLHKEVNSDVCAKRNIPVLRRPSGGATVILGPGCVMWSVIAPFEDVPTLDAIHAFMLEPLAAALSEIGPPVAREGTSDLVISTADGVKKVSGNALRVRRHSVLYHGTLLDSFPLGLVGQLLQHPPREPQYRMERQHDKFLANLSIGRKKINKAVQTAFSAWTFRTNWPRDQVHRLVESRYGQSDWTERL